MGKFWVEICGLVAMLMPLSVARAEAPQFALIEHRSVDLASEHELLEPAKTTGSSTRNRSASPETYGELIYAVSVRAAEQRYGLPPGLLRALIWTESRFNPMAVSPAGAAGLAQLMPGTARYLGVINRHDPLASIDGGARYLREMLDKFGAIHLALAAYNAGPRAVTRAGGIPRNSETPGYVRSVLARWRTISSQI